MGPVDNTTQTESVLSSVPHGPRSLRTRNYMLGILTGFVATATAIIVNFWLTPFSLRFLDREEFAIFTLSSDILLWLTLFNLGIAAGLRVRVAQLTGRPDQEQMNALVSTAFFSQLAAVVLVLLAGSGLALVFPNFFHVSPRLQRDAGQVVILMTCGVAMSLGTQTFSALLIAHQQAYIDNLIQLALQALRTLVTVTLLVWGWKLISLAFASVVCSAVVAALAVVRCYRIVPALKIKYRLASKELLREVGGLGLWFSILNLSSIIILGLDRTVAGRVISLAAVTTLTLTGRAYEMARTLLAQLASTAQPGLGQLIGGGDRPTALATFQRLFSLLTGTSIVASLVLWSCNASFVGAWVGPKNYGGGLLDAALALNLFVKTSLLPCWSVLAAGLVIRPQAIGRLIEAGLNLGLSIILARHFGLVGVAISTGLAAILVSSWYYYYLTAGFFRVSLGALVGRRLSRLALLTLILLPVACVARVLAIKQGGYGGAFFAAIAVAVPGALLLWWLGFDPATRWYFRRTVVEFSWGSR